MSEIGKQILFMYIGLKVAIGLKTKHMTEKVFLKRNTPVPFDAVYGRKLIAEYPKVFREYEESDLEKFEREHCADLVPLSPGTVVLPVDPGKKNPPPVVAESGPLLAEAGVDDLTEEEKAALDGFKAEEAEFEMIDGSLQCPFCAKAYKENSGRGKHVLINHLEEAHRKLWAQAILSQAKKE